MTLMCIERSQSPTHKSSFLQGRKSPVNNNNNNNNNNNINQHNNANNNNNHHHRRNSVSPPLSKQQQQQQDNKSHCNPESSRKLERSTSEPVQDSNRRGSVQTSATNSSRYKTELCRPFEENGTCKYGDKCQFAHGQKELRSMARHPKYKTELCRTFHSTGLCPYGPRCHFIHNSEQSKKSLLTNLAGSVPNTTPIAPLPRQKVLSSIGSAGDISPPSSHGGSPTGMKSFDDLYKQPLSLSPVVLAQSLVNLNHNSGTFDLASAMDCVQDAFNQVADGALVDSSLDNYGIVRGILADYYMNPSSEDGFYFRLPIFDRILSSN